MRITYLMRLVTLSVTLSLCFGATALAAPNRAMRWDPAVEWRTYPRQMNPSPDHYGNPGVWSYMGSTSLAHDPLSYYLLPVYQATSANSWVQVWQDPNYGYLLVSRARPTPFFPGGGPSTGMVPFVGMMAILAWTSPVTTDVTVTGSAKLVDAECFDVGSGVVWSVDRDAESLYTSVLPSDGETSFSFVASVVAGQTLYFILDPGADDMCDTTHVNLVISTK